MDLNEFAPRLKRAVAAPMSPWWRSAVVTACAAVLWGVAWLPGGTAVEFLGWTVLITVILVGLVRRGVRRKLYRRLRLPPPSLPVSERYSRWQVCIVLLGMSALFYSWPLRLNLLIHRPLLDRFAWHAYAEVPFFERPRTPRLIGLIIVSDLRVDANNVWLNVPQSGHLIWSADGPREYYSWLRTEAPWYYRWAVPPTSGKWIAVPKNN
jgi:hypothetical protein